MISIAYCRARDKHYAGGISPGKVDAVMNGNIPGWDYDALSPFSWLAAQNVWNPDAVFPDSEEDTYLDEFWDDTNPGQKVDYRFR